MNNILEEKYNFIYEDEQYNKYGLLKTNKNRELIKPLVGTFPNYIHDKRCGYIILDEKIPTAVLEKIFFIKIKKNYIKELSLKPDFNKEAQREAKNYIKDEKEFGKYFSFENLKENLPTKLYSTNFRDTLWVKIENNNITFEELVDDFEKEEEAIKTQVVHCEYFQEGNNFFISHLDHEYVFYSEEEYREREKNINQKGKAKKRVKTFKIDDSKIPFIFPLKEGVNEERINILLLILEGYFKKKDLLKEYFQKIEENQ